MEYNHKDIENKWQSRWKALSIYKVNEDANKNKKQGGQTFMTTYPEWLKENEGGTYQQYKQEMGL